MQNEQDNGLPFCTIVFSLPGKPIPQARPRAFRLGAGVRIVSPKGGSTRGDLAQAFLEMARTVEDGEWKPWEGPVRLQVLYEFLGPKTVWEGKEMLTKPDLDNLDKMVLDALNGVAFRDDSQVVTKTSTKRYGVSERTTVQLHFYHPTPKPTKTRKRAA